MKRNSYSAFKRFTALVVLIAFVTTNVGWAAPVSTPVGAHGRAPLRFEVPSELGTVRRLFLTNNNSSFPRKRESTSALGPRLRGDDMPKRFVVYIHDAHADKAAQRHVSGLTEYFGEKLKIKTILAEGASGKADLSGLRNFPHKDITERAAAQFLEAAQITGFEYAALTLKSDYQLIGIENNELYDEHFQAYIESAKVKNQNRETLQKLLSGVSRAKEKFYNKDLYEFDRMTRSGVIPAPAKRHLVGGSASGGKANDARLIPYLARRARELGIDFDHLTMIRAFLRMQVLESFLNLPWLVSGEADRRRYVKKLNEIQESIRPEILFREMDELTESVKERLFRNDEEREIDRRANRLNLLIRLAELTLSPEDWEKYLEIRARNDRVGARHAVPLLLNSAEEFYRLAGERDGALTDNLLRELSHTDRAFLITGGFHGPALEKAMEEAGISFISIYPHVSENPDPKRYVERMAGDTKMFFAGTSVSPLLFSGHISKHTLMPRLLTFNPGFRERFIEARKSLIAEKSTVAGFGASSETSGGRTSDHKRRVVELSEMTASRLLSKIKWWSKPSVEQRGLGKKRELAFLLRYIHDDMNLFREVARNKSGELPDDAMAAFRWYYGLEDGIAHTRDETARLMGPKIWPYTARRRAHLGLKLAFLVAVGGPSQAYEILSAVSEKERPAVFTAMLKQLGRLREKAEYIEAVKRNRLQSPEQINEQVSRVMAGLPERIRALARKNLKGGYGELIRRLEEKSAGQAEPLFVERFPRTPYIRLVLAASAELGVSVDQLLGTERFKVRNHSIEKALRSLPDGAARIRWLDRSGGLSQKEREALMPGAKSLAQRFQRGRAGFIRITSLLKTAFLHGVSPGQLMGSVETGDFSPKSIKPRTFFSANGVWVELNSASPRIRADLDVISGLKTGGTIQLRKSLGDTLTFVPADLLGVSQIHISAAEGRRHEELTLEAEVVSRMAGSDQHYSVALSSFLIISSGGEPESWAETFAPAKKSWRGGGGSLHTELFELSWAPETLHLTIAPLHDQADVRVSVEFLRSLPLSVEGNALARIAPRRGEKISRVSVRDATRLFLSAAPRAGFENVGLGASIHGERTDAAKRQEFGFGAASADDFRDFIHRVHKQVGFSKLEELHHDAFTEAATRNYYNYVNEIGSLLGVIRKLAKSLNVRLYNGLDPGTVVRIENYGPQTEYQVDGQKPLNLGDQQAIIRDEIWSVDLYWRAPAGEVLPASTIAAVPKLAPTGPSAPTQLAPGAVTRPQPTLSATKLTTRQVHILNSLLWWGPEDAVRVQKSERVTLEEFLDAHGANGTTSFKLMALSPTTLFQYPKDPRYQVQSNRVEFPQGGADVKILGIEKSAIVFKLLPTEASDPRKYDPRQIKISDLKSVTPLPSGFGAGFDLDAAIRNILSLDRPPGSGFGVELPSEKPSEEITSQKRSRDYDNQIYRDPTDILALTTRQSKHEQEGNRISTGSQENYDYLTYTERTSNSGFGARERAAKNSALVYENFRKRYAQAKENTDLFKKNSVLRTNILSALDRVDTLFRGGDYFRAAAVIGAYVLPLRSRFKTSVERKFYSNLVSLAKSMEALSLSAAWEEPIWRAGQPLAKDRFTEERRERFEELLRDEYGLTLDNIVTMMERTNEDEFLLIPLQPTRSSLRHSLKDTILLSIAHDPDGEREILKRLILHDLHIQYDEEINHLRLAKPGGESVFASLPAENLDVTGHGRLSWAYAIHHFAMKAKFAAAARRSQDKAADEPFGNREIPFQPEPVESIGPSLPLMPEPSLGTESDTHGFGATGELLLRGASEARRVAWAPRRPRGTAALSGRPPLGQAASRPGMRGKTAATGAVPFGMPRLRDGGLAMTRASSGFGKPQEEDLYRGSMLALEDKLREYIATLSEGRRTIRDDIRNSTIQRLQGVLDRFVDGHDSLEAARELHALSKDDYFSGDALRRLRLEFVKLAEVFERPQVPDDLQSWIEKNLYRAPLKVRYGLLNNLLAEIYGGITLGDIVEAGRRTVRAELWSILSTHRKLLDAFENANANGVSQAFFAENLGMVWPDGGRHAKEKLPRSLYRPPSIGPRAWAHLIHYLAQKAQASKSGFGAAVGTGRRIIARDLGGVKKWSYQGSGTDFGGGSAENFVAVPSEKNDLPAKLLLRPGVQEMTYGLGNVLGYGRMDADVDNAGEWRREEIEEIPVPGDKDRLLLAGESNHLPVFSSGGRTDHMVSGGAEKFLGISGNVFVKEEAHDGLGRGKGNKLSVLELIGGEMKRSTDMAGRELREIFLRGNFLDGNARLQELKGLPKHDAGSRKAWLSVANLGIYLNVFFGRMLLHFYSRLSHKNNNTAYHKRQDRFFMPRVGIFELAVSHLVHSAITGFGAPTPKDMGSDRVRFVNFEKVPPADRAMLIEARLARNSTGLRAEAYERDLLDEDEKANREVLVIYRGPRPVGLIRFSFNLRFQTGAIGYLFILNSDRRTWMGTRLLTEALIRMARQNILHVEINLLDKPALPFWEHVAGELKMQDFIRSAEIERRGTGKRMQIRLHPYAAGFGAADIPRGESEHLIQRVEEALKQFHAQASRILGLSADEMENAEQIREHAISAVNFFSEYLGVLRINNIDDFVLLILNMNPGIGISVYHDVMDQLIWSSAEGREAFRELFEKYPIALGISLSLLQSGDVEINDLSSAVVDYFKIEYPDRFPKSDEARIKSLTTQMIGGKPLGYEPFDRVLQRSIGLLKTKWEEIDQQITEAEQRGDKLGIVRFREFINGKSYASLFDALAENPTKLYDVLKHFYRLKRKEDLYQQLEHYARDFPFDFLSSLALIFDRRLTERVESKNKSLFSSLFIIRVSNEGPASHILATHVLLISAFLDQVLEGKYGGEGMIKLITAHHLQNRSFAVKIGILNRHFRKFLAEDERFNAVSFDGEFRRKLGLPDELDFAGFGAAEEPIHGDSLQDARKALTDVFLTYGVKWAGDQVGFSLVPKNADWVMHGLRPVGAAPYRRPEKLPVVDLRFPMEQLPSIGAMGSRRVLLGIANVLGKERPVAVKQFSGGDSEFDILHELEHAEVRSYLGVSPELYGVLEDDRDRIVAYAMEVVMGHVKNAYELYLDDVEAPSKDDLKTIFARLAEVGLEVPGEYYENFITSLDGLSGFGAGGKVVETVSSAYGAKRIWPDFSIMIRPLNSLGPRAWRSFSIASMIASAYGGWIWNMRMLYWLVGYIEMFVKSLSRVIRILSSALARFAFSKSAEEDSTRTQSWPRALSTFIDFKGTSSSIRNFIRRISLIFRKESILVSLRTRQQSEARPLRVPASDRGSSFYRQSLRVSRFLQEAQERHRRESGFPGSMVFHAGFWGLPIDIFEAIRPFSDSPVGKIITGDNVRQAAPSTGFGAAEYDSWLNERISDAQINEMTVFSSTTQREKPLPQLLPYRRRYRSQNPYQSPFGGLGGMKSHPVIKMINTPNPNTTLTKGEVSLNQKEVAPDPDNTIKRVRSVEPTFSRLNGSSIQKVPFDLEGDLIEGSLSLSGNLAIVNKNVTNNKNPPSGFGAGETMARKPLSATRAELTLPVIHDSRTPIHDVAAGFGAAGSIVIPDAEKAIRDGEITAEGILDLVRSRGVSPRIAGQDARPTRLGARNDGSVQIHLIFPEMESWEHAAEFIEAAFGEKAREIFPLVSIHTAETIRARSKLSLSAKPERLKRAILDRLIAQAKGRIVVVENMETAGAGEFPRWRGNVRRLFIESKSGAVHPNSLQKAVFLSAERIDQLVEQGLKRLDENRWLDIETDPVTGEIFDQIQRARSFDIAA